MDHTACALDALEGVVGLEHVAQRLQALHLAARNAIADLVLGQAEDRNAIASMGDDVTSLCKKASTYDGLGPEALQPLVLHEPSSERLGTFGADPILVQAAAQAVSDKVRFWASRGDDVFMTKASTFGLHNMRT